MTTDRMERNKGIAINGNSGIEGVEKGVDVVVVEAREVEIAPFSKFSVWVPLQFPNDP